jgi:Flp pilus assembly protein TadD
MRRAVLPLLLFGLLTNVAAAEGDLPAAATLAEGLSLLGELRSRGETDAAITLAGQLVATYPDSLDLHIAWQDLRLARGERKLLLAEYTKRALKPDATADEHFLYGRLLDGTRSAGEFRRALQIAPEHFPALCSLATRQIERGDYEEAGTILERARKLRPESAVPPNLLGWLAEKVGDVRRAEAMYREAIGLNANYALPQVNLGMLLLGQGRGEEATKLFESAQALEPAEPMAMIGLGLSLVAAGKTAKALECFQKAVALDSNTVASLNLLGGAYQSLEQYALAKDAFEKALRIKADDTTTLLNLAYTALLEGRPGDGRKWAEKAVAADSSSAIAQYILGLCFEYSGQTGGAEKCYLRAMQLDPAMPDYPRMLGALLLNLGRLKEAVGYYARAADLAGQTPAALLDLAFAHVAADDAKEAVDCFEKVVKADPGNLTALMNLGLLYQEKLRNKSKAIAAYEAYLTKGGTDPRVLNWLAALRRD